MMSRPTLALALCSVGIASMTLGAFLLVGPAALCVGGLALFGMGAFAVDVEPRVQRAQRMQRAPAGNSLAPQPIMPSPMQREQPSTGGRIGAKGTFQ